MRWRWRAGSGGDARSIDDGEGEPVAGGRRGVLRKGHAPEPTVVGQDHFEGEHVDGSVEGSSPALTASARLSRRPPAARNPTTRHVKRTPWSSTASTSHGRRNKTRATTPSTNTSASQTKSISRSSSGQPIKTRSTTAMTITSPTMMLSAQPSRGTSAASPSPSARRRNRARENLARAPIPRRCGIHRRRTRHA
jgi:hypothetical protein